MNVPEIQILMSADIYKLLGDVTRLKIMLCCIEQKISVGGIVEKLDISQSLISHNLRLLKAANLVEAEKKGKQVFYQVRDEHVSHMLKDLIDHVKNCIPNAS